MLLPTATFLCVLVICVEVSHGSNDEKIPLVRLAELQIEHCTEVSLCTLRVLNEVSKNTTSLSCCHPCSCEADCIETGTCCPDYHLIDEIGTKISNSISEFSDRLTISDQANFTGKQQDQLTCIEASEPKFRHIYERSKVTYSMAARCPSKSILEISKKCEQPKDIDIFEYDLFIPVTSLKTGTTYRNKYCFLCNEGSNGTTDGEFWRTSMACGFRFHKVYRQVTPYDFFTTVLKRKLFYCYLLFKPPSTDIVANRCEFVNIDTCPEGSNNQLNEICKSFHLPVTFYPYSWSSDRYRNIGCFLCNTDKEFKPVCESIDGNGYRLEMYEMELSIPRDEQNNVVHSEEHENHVLNVQVLNQENDICNIGFIPDATRNESTCARVLCPWNFYINEEGKCIPTFSRLQGVYFTAMLEVRRAELFGKIMLDEIRNNYLKEIAAIGESMFQFFTYGLWEKENDIDLLTVSFITEQSKYNYHDMLRQYASFLDTICILTINVNSSAVKVSSFQARSPWTAYLALPMLIAKPRVIHEYKEPNKSLAMLEIHITHLCYRVAEPISDTDYYILNRYFEYALQSNENDIFICADDFYKNMPDISSAFMFGGTCAQTTVNFIQNKQKYKTTNVDNSNDEDSNNDVDNENTNSNDNNNNQNNTVKEPNSGQHENTDDDTWFNLSEGLLFGIVAVAVVVVVAILAIVLVKRKSPTEFARKSDAQEPKQE